LLSKRDAAPTTKVSSPVKKSAPAAFKPLKVGSKGQAVKNAQTLLGIKADGEFGPGTEKAVKAFQSSKKLDANGIVDAITFKALKSK